MLSAEKSWDKALEEQIDAALPSTLSVAASYKLDEKGQNLCLEFPQIKKLDNKTDYPPLIAVIKKFGGSWCNRKEGGLDVPYFEFPKPGLHPLEKTEQATERVKQVGASQNVFGEGAAPSDAKPAADNQELPKPVDAAKAEPAGKTSEVEKPTPPQTESQSQPVRQVPSCSEDFKDPNYVKPIKQPSPITQFQQRLCSVCEDSGEKCNSRTTSGREVMARCQEALRLQALEDVNGGIAALVVHLKAVTVALDKLASRPAPSFPRGGSRQSPQPQQPQEKETYFVENGVVWANSRTREQKPCHKAYEEKNRKGEGFTVEFLQLKQTVEAKKASKESTGFGGFFYWVVAEGRRPYVGRVKTEKKEEAKKQ